MDNPPCLQLFLPFGLQSPFSLYACVAQVRHVVAVVASPLMSDSSGSSEGSFVEKLGKLVCQILQGLMVGLLSSLGLGTWEAWVSDSLQGLGVDWFVEQVGVGQLGKLGCQILQGLMVGLLSSLGLGTWEAWVSDSWFDDECRGLMMSAVV